MKCNEVQGAKTENAQVKKNYHKMELRVTITDIITSCFGIKFQNPCGWTKNMTLQAQYL